MKKVKAGNSKVYPCGSPLIIGPQFNHPGRTLRKIRNKKKNSRMPLKCPKTNYQSCSLKLSSRLLGELGLQWRFSTVYDQGLKPCVHWRDSPNDAKSKFNPYLYQQEPEQTSSFSGNKISLNFSHHPYSCIGKHLFTIT